MTDDGPRTGAVRDVPPPRPVPPAQVEETGLTRAARAVAEAVAGMVSGRSGGAPAAGSAGTDSRRSAMAGLRDVVGAVASTVGGALGADRGRAAGKQAPSAGRDRNPAALLGDLLAAVAPRLPIRDAARLRQDHPGASDDEIADALVARAARLTSGIGAATGGLSAAHWFAPPSLVALPLELGAETVLVAGVEVVLIGELHELYGRPAPGGPKERASAYLAGWTAQRSVDAARTTGMSSLLGAASVRALQRRLTRRLAGSVPAAAPFLVGAAIAGRGNRRATEELARTVLADLRATRPPDPRGGGRG